MTLASDAKVSGISVLGMNSLEGIGSGTGSNALDLTTISTLTNINISASSGTDFVKIGDTTAFVINDTASGCIFFTYSGSTVVINNNPQVDSYTNFIQVHGGPVASEFTVNHGYFEPNDIYDLNNGTGKAFTIIMVNASGQIRTGTDIYNGALTHLNLTGDTDNFYGLIARADINTTSVEMVNPRVGGAAIGADYITALFAKTDHLPAGDGANFIIVEFDTINTNVVGTGANSIVTDPAATGPISFGTNPATVVNDIALGVTGVTGAAETVAGLNNVGLVTIHFVDAASESQ